MKGTNVIFQKELKRVFKDPKMIFSLFVLPVVLMVGIYGLIGFLGEQQVSQTKEHTSLVYMQNAPADLEASLNGFTEGSKITYLQANESLDTIKDGIYKGDTDLLIVFPENFSQQIENFKAGDSIPDVQTFYNPSESYSQHAHDTFITALNDNYLKTLLANRLGSADILTVFTINETNPNSIIQDSAKASGQFLGMMLPYLITILLFAGTMGLSTDVITGEKERGTLASMLVTPIKRSEIVLGKLLALTVLSILSALVYVVAMTISMPKAMGAIGDVNMSVSFNMTQILQMGIIVLTLSFLYVSLVGIVSVFAKTVKEATSYVMPLYMLVIVAGLFTMMAPAEGRATYEYLIPIYNCSIALSEIFTNELTAIHFVMTFGVSIVVGIAATTVIAKAFNSERITFSS